MQEIETYAAAVGVMPTTVLQRAANLGGNKWAVWLKGGSCSMRTADRIREFMANNPAPADVKSGAAA